MWLAMWFCVVCTVPVIPAATKTKANLNSARDRLALALTSENDSAALKAIDAMFQEEPGNVALRYLRDRLQRRTRKPASPSPQ